MAIQVDVRDEVRAAMEAALPRMVEALVTAVRSAAGDRLLGVEEAAQVLGCTASALRKKIERRAIPVVRHGRSIRLRMSDLLGEGVRP